MTGTPGATTDAPGAMTGAPGTQTAAAFAGATDASSSTAGTAPPVTAASPAPRQAAAPAVTAALPLQPPAAPGAAAPANIDGDPAGGAAAPQLLPAALASVTPARGPSPGASDSSRIDGGSPSGGASQPPGTLNDLTSATAALSAAAAPNSTAEAGAPSAPQAPAHVMAQVHAEVGGGAWANELGARLHWMAGAGVGSASLRLTPEQLGPVEVRISVHQNAASVWFSATQADTRSALEQALPRLRELFSAQGMNLAQAGVSDHSARGAQPEPQAPAVSLHTAVARGLNATSVTPAARSHQGLIDTYA